MKKSDILLIVLIIVIVGTLIATISIGNKLMGYITSHTHDIEVVESNDNAISIDNNLISNDLILVGKDESGDIKIYSLEYHGMEFLISEFSHTNIYGRYGSIGITQIIDNDKYGND